MSNKESGCFMRLRNLKDKDVLLNECNYLVKNPKDYKGLWQDVFGNEAPLHLEIGMGKGDFIYKMALTYPHINFIGIEKYSNVLARAIKKYPNGLPNLRIINMDALDLGEVFFKEIDTIYLNFSDPWPKKRWASRRLTSEVFLRIYDDLFGSKKTVIMKTDNINLFAYSLVSLSNYGYVLKEVSLDLEHSEIPNVLTEYEHKFQALGVKINYLQAEK